MAEDLPPGVRRVLAPNPSPMTFAGTNSYIVGAGEVAVIDPGPADASHLAALLAALDPGEHVVRIIVTHAHRDHSDLAPALAAATGAPVMGFGGAMGGRAGEGVDAGFRPDRRLRDGDLVAGEGWTLRAIHTPGHLSDHLCLGLGDFCFSGDHVMGWASSIVSPPEGVMADYMASLARLAAEPWRLLLPGHGAPVTDPAGRIAELADHRRAREAQVLAALGRAPLAPAAIARVIYAGTDPALLPAAERNVLAHLIDLAAQGRAVEQGDGWRRASGGVAG